jgi:putative transposase
MGGYASLFLEGKAILPQLFNPSHERMHLMFRISKDSPAYYITSVAKDRLPVFLTTTVKNIACSILDEARRSAGFLLLAYVLMTDHLHPIIGSELKPSKVLQYVNGIAAHRVICYLKLNGHELSLKKLRHTQKDREYRYSLWDHHPQAKVLTNEDVVLQKVNYVHQNPVRAGLVTRAEDYIWSSVRCWAGTQRQDEPLIMDIDKITWRVTKRGTASR